MSCDVSLDGDGVLRSTCCCISAVEDVLKAKARVSVIIILTLQWQLRCMRALGDAQLRTVVDNSLSIYGVAVYIVIYILVRCLLFKKYDWEDTATLYATSSLIAYVQGLRHYMLEHIHLSNFTDLVVSNVYGFAGLLSLHALLILVSVRCPTQRA